MKTALLVLAGLVLALFAASVAALLALRATLAPLPGEWSVPLALGPLKIEAGVPSLLRLATAPIAGPLLDGRSFATRHGRLELAWVDHQLQVRCAPCVLQPASVQQDALVLPEVRLGARRLGELLEGEFQAAA